MRIASGIDFLQSKNKYWMYDESPLRGSVVLHGGNPQDQTTSPIILFYYFIVNGYCDKI